MDLYSISLALRSVAQLVARPQDLWIDYIPICKIQSTNIKYHIIN